MTEWSKQTLAEVIARTVQQWPGQEALVISGRRMTYPELRQSVQQVAAGLHALGIRRGDHVAVCMGM